MLAWLFVLTAACGDDGLVGPAPGTDAGRHGSHDAGQFDAGPPPPPPPPDSGPPPTTDIPPPPISGGTMLITADGRRAVAADPDRDAVYVVDLASSTLEHTIALEPGDEPGRSVEDGAGIVHVALRGRGALAAIDPATGTVLFRRDVCPLPRGLARRASGDAIIVACAGGELLTLPASGGPPMSALAIDGDIRDVVADGDRLLVSRFRSAELLVVEGGVVTARHRPLDATIAGALGPTDIVPRVGWRLVARPGGGAYLLHQRATASPLAVERSGYSGGTERCPSGVVSASISTFDGATMPGPGPMLGSTVLPVDVAVAPDGAALAVADAATDDGIRFYRRSQLDADSVVDCSVGTGAVRVPGFFGQAIAVAWAPSGLVVQYREPAALIVLGATATLVRIDAPTVRHVGHELFHRATPSLMACASCHPEGGEDGHVWDFTGTRRRTQTMLGGILATAPFHWSGDQPDLSAIMQATFVERMHGRTPVASEIEALGAWLDAQPAPRPSVPDADAAARGAAVFASAGCADCHSGEHFTDNRTVDVGTGGGFQVPSLLGVGHRAPYQHDGCAPTLEAVLEGTCTEPDRHVPSSTLDAAERADLIAYLRSL